MNLEVLLENRSVGVLTRLSGENIIFVFADDYVNDPNRPTLSQYYLKADSGLRRDVRPTRTKLPPWFSNLLPEGALLEYIARKANINSAREFSLLGFLGNDLPGAVRIVPEGSDLEDIELPASAKPEKDEPLRFSLAGVQLKLSAVLNNHGKVTIPAAGLGGNWIIKLPSATFPGVPENEAAMLTLAAHAGITVPEHGLVAIDSIKGLPDNLGNFVGAQALAVRRFDRGPEGKRIHMEDLAQVFGIYPHDKYKEVGSTQIVKLIGQIMGPEAAQDFIARLTFIILTGNGDMHLKNWSLLYPDGKKPILSPAYDLVSTVPYMPNEQIALNIAHEKSFQGMTMDRFRRLADDAGLPEKETLTTVERVTDAVRDAWPKIREKSKLPGNIASKIDEHMLTLPLLKESGKPTKSPAHPSVPSVPKLVPKPNQESGMGGRAG
jgi:serine/threonine-protein kinase HipA